FSSRRRHTMFSRDWSSDVCSSDLAFFGIGMYTTAVLSSGFDVPFLWTLPAAAIMAALFGAVLGVVSFRVKAVRGELFALLTLARSEERRVGQGRASAGARER